MRKVCGSGQLGDDRDDPRERGIFVAGQPRQVGPRDVAGQRQTDHAAIVEAIGSDAPPLRLALGRDAVDAIRAKHDTLASELTAWKKLSRSTALD